MATGIPPGTSVTVVYVDNNTDYCVQPAAAIVVVDRETTADVEVVCGPVTPARHSPALFGFLRDSRQARPSLRWLYFDAACDGLFEASALIDLDSSYQLSRLPLGRACLHSHGKTVEVDVRGDTRFDVERGVAPLTKTGSVSVCPTFSVSRARPETQAARHWSPRPLLLDPVPGRWDQRDAAEVGVDTAHRRRQLLGRCAADHAVAIAGDECRRHVDLPIGELRRRLPVPMEMR